MAGGQRAAWLRPHGLRNLGSGMQPRDVALWLTEMEVEQKEHGLENQTAPRSRASLPLAKGMTLVKLLYPLGLTFLVYTMGTYWLERAIVRDV